MPQPSQDDVIRNILTNGFGHFGLTEDIANAFWFGIVSRQWLSNQVEVCYPLQSVL